MTDQRPGSADDIDALVALSLRGLPRMYRPAHQQFAQTSRRTPAGGLRPEGTNLRYAAIVALGASRLSRAAQEQLLHGSTAAALADAVAAQAVESLDPGAVALAAWAGVEISGIAPPLLFDQLADDIESPAPHPTVDLAWALTAFVGARGLGDFTAASERLAARLLDAQTPSGLFPHTSPCRTHGGLRSHVGCFADQVYPIQALSRYFVATGDARALAAADRCARRIVELQGSAGQWWWHYDVRTGGIVERYPVYSVHQHAMAPMALFELAEAGGADHADAIALGLGWLQSRPETAAQLIDESAGVIWRKVGRREPLKAARSARAVATALRPGIQLRALDTLFPPGLVDYECRPYELGWLLYTWPTEPAPPAGSTERQQNTAESD